MATFRAFMRRHAVLAYFVLTFVFSWGSILLVGADPGLLLGTETPAPAQETPLYVAFPLGPSLAGLLMTGILGGRAGFGALLARLTTWRVGLRWYALALPAVPLAIGAVLAALALFSLAPAAVLFAGGDKASLLAYGIMVGLFVGVFEELGWTGFAVPTLRLRHGVVATGLMAAAVWGLWHYPLFAQGDTAAARDGGGLSGRQRARPQHMNQV